MIQNKHDLKEYISIEKKFYNPSFFGFILSLFGASEKNIIYRYQKRLRIWEYHSNKGHKIRTLISKFKCSSLGYKYGLHLNINVFDKGLKIMHLGSIIVNENARVGKFCSIHINTAIAPTNGSSDSPKLGDYCILGVGSSIIGNIELGNHVAIGAGAVVVNSFNEGNITLGGVPAKIISHKGIL